MDFVLSRHGPLPDPSSPCIPHLLPLPVPVPISLPPFSFLPPHPCITSPHHILRFHSSDSGRQFLGFISGLNDAIKCHKLSDYCRESPTVRGALQILDALASWVDHIPPLQHPPSRCGDLAFREWQDLLQKDGPALMLTVLPEAMASAQIELFPYFAGSFGDACKIDYGAGHETNFVAWLFFLARLGLVNEDDYQALVSRVFLKYLQLMRKLQATYRLEPATSHGVWGLDDYHLLPFVFGSAQLVDHKHMKPKSIHNDDILENFYTEYLYLGCVRFLKKTKKGHLAEHSPMIDDISALPSWNQVNSGMLRMYKAEVLEKLPIMQHFLFGSLIRW